MPAASTAPDLLTFIDVSTPAAVKDQEKVRFARSHAITTALARQRRTAQQHGENFRSHSTSKKRKHGNTDKSRVPSSFVPESIGNFSIDPFDSLVVDSRRLTHLFYSRSSLQAGEPVFSVSDAVRYQSLHTIFESGLSDGALTAAVALTLCYAANGWKLDQEGMHYGTIALRQIRRNLANPVIAASATTIGAVLLLLGNETDGRLHFEYRLGDRDRAQAHLDGIVVLLGLCSKHGVELSQALRRAIYWQDLFSSMFVQTQRIVQFSNFFPYREGTAYIAGKFDRPLVGFMAKAEELGPEFMGLATEVASLYRDRMTWEQHGKDPRAPENLDVMQARIEGHLHDLRQSAPQGIVAACCIAVHLCAYGLWVSIWNGALVPRGLTAQLLHQLRQYAASASQDETELFFWLVHVGKTFAVDAHVREGMDQVWKSRFSTTHRELRGALPDSPSAVQILNTFIWSDLFYNDKGQWFWERITI